MEEHEFWKWIAGLLGGVAVGQGALLWKLITSIRERPTYVEVERMIDKALTMTPYAQDKRWLTGEVTQIKKDIETVDRHVQNLLPKVEELHLWMTMQRERTRRDNERMEKNQ